MGLLPPTLTYSTVLGVSEPHGSQAPAARVPAAPGRQEADGCSQPTTRRAPGSLPSTPCHPGHREGYTTVERGQQLDPSRRLGCGRGAPRGAIVTLETLLLGSALRAEALPPSSPSQSKQAAKLLWKWYCTAGPVPSASAQPGAATQIPEAPGGRGFSQADLDHRSSGLLPSLSSEPESQPRDGGWGSVSTLIHFFL